MNTENILMLNRQKKYELYNMTPLTTGVASYIWVLSYYLTSHGNILCNQETLQKKWFPV